ncbi:MAG: hypothetical protein M1374_01785 [Firmicutes bacterium]|jgi:uncharacterized protein (TIGR04255 family)|nr:hypothetical protein [Bacillota bacterium]
MQLRGQAYLLDIDVFTEESQSFEPAQLTKQPATLHDQIDRFFYWSLTDNGAAYFGREVLK